MSRRRFSRPRPRPPRHGRDSPPTRVRIRVRIRIRIVLGRVARNAHKTVRLAFFRRRKWPNPSLIRDGVAAYRVPLAKATQEDLDKEQRAGRDPQEVAPRPRARPRGWGGDSTERGKPGVHSSVSVFATRLRNHDPPLGEDLLPAAHAKPVVSGPSGQPCSVCVTRHRLQGRSCHPPR